MMEKAKINYKLLFAMIAAVSVLVGVLLIFLFRQDKA